MEVAFYIGIAGIVILVGIVIFLYFAVRNRIIKQKPSDGPESTTDWSKHNKTT